MFCFNVHYLVSFLVCNHLEREREKERERERESVASLVTVCVLCSSFSRYRRLVCNVWLRCFLIILTSLFAMVPVLEFSSSVG